MKKTRTVVVPEKVTKEDSYFCELCGVEIDRQGNRYLINSESFKEEVKVEFGIFRDLAEDSYQEEEMKLDVCYSCFKEKIKPLIEKTFNVKFRSEGLF